MKKNIIVTLAALTILFIGYLLVKKNIFSIYEIRNKDIPNEFSQVTDVRSLQKYNLLGDTYIILPVSEEDMWVFNHARNNNFCSGAFRNTYGFLGDAYMSEDRLSLILKPITSTDCNENVNYYSQESILLHYSQEPQHIILRIPDGSQFKSIDVYLGVIDENNLESLGEYIVEENTDNIILHYGIPEPVIDELNTNPQNYLLFK